MLISLRSFLPAVILGLFIAKNTPAPDVDFMNAANQANLTELQAASLVATHSKMAFMAKYAEKITADHSRAQQELTALAQEEKISLATTPDTEHQNTLDRLAKISGPAFDSAYMKTQLLDHRVTIDLFKQEGRDGKDALAKAYALKYLPALEEHLDMIERKFPGLSPMADSTTTRRQ